MLYLKILFFFSMKLNLKTGSFTSSPAFLPIVIHSFLPSNSSVLKSPARSLRVSLLYKEGNILLSMTHSLDMYTNFLFNRSIFNLTIFLDVEYLCLYLSHRLHSNTSLISRAHCLPYKFLEPRPLAFCA